MIQTKLHNRRATRFLSLIAAAPRRKCLAGPSPVLLAGSVGQLVRRLQLGWRRAPVNDGGGNTIVIDNGGTAIIDSTTTGLCGGYDVALGDSNGSGAINMSAGTLTNPSNYQEVDVGASGSGFFTQSGGVNGLAANSGLAGQGGGNELFIGQVRSCRDIRHDRWLDRR